MVRCKRSNMGQGQVSRAATAQWLGRPGRNTATRGSDNSGHEIAHLRYSRAPGICQDKVAMQKRCTTASDISSTSQHGLRAITALL